MKIKSLGFTLLAVLVAGSGANAGDGGADWCVTFDGFCDGIQMNVDFDTSEVLGSWENLDCAGASAPMDGAVQSGGGQIRLFCMDAGCPNDGQDFLFILKGNGRLFDLLGSDGAGGFQAFVVNSPFTLTPGQCSFAQGNGAISSSGSIQN